MFLPDTEVCERYKLIELINHGGMGDVWLATDNVLGRNVAIKSINPSLLESNPKAIKTFMDEAKIGASLIGHPNVVTILDYGIHNYNESKPEHFIVMEYIEGINLAKFINVFKPKIDAETYYNLSLYIGREIERAIDYAHRQKILHRDIKPLNVFISTFGIPKVGDFGLARFFDEVTRTHTVNNFNSPPYCSPEQWKGEKYSYRSDIYQLGCTLYHLFTGRLPFETNKLAQMYAHLNKKPQSPKDFCPYLSEELEQAILKMLSKERDERVELWELNDILAKELQKTFKLTIKVDKHIDNVDNVIDKISSIADLSVKQLKDGKEVGFDFPDFNEVLSDGLQLILNDITNFKIVAFKEQELQTSS